MNSYERVMKTLNHQEPDRVPILELVITPKIAQALIPEVQTQHEFEYGFGLDAVCVRAAYKKIRDDGNLYTDEWGVTYQYNGEETPHVVVPALEPDDFDLDKFNMPKTDVDGRFATLPELVKRYKGEKAIAFHLRAVFMNACNVVGIDNLLMYFYINPDFVNGLFDKILDEQIILAKAAVEMGADLIFETDDVAYNAGPLFSPDLFCKFLLPRYKKFTDIMHSMGVKVIKHSDGNLMKIIPLIIESGFDGLHSLDPLAGMDAVEVKQKYGDKLVICGNVDCGNLLAFGTEEEVGNIVKNLIKNCAPGGGYILSSSNSIMSSTNPRNYAVMVETCKKYGEYPINL